MEFSTADFERLIMFEHARKNSEAQYKNDPLDSENLLKWGGALLELSQFQPIPEAKLMLNDAISKLEEALTINPGKHQALWCIANAYTAHAFYVHDPEEAKEHFDKATEYFQRAENEDPGNDTYRKSLDSSLKAPELHMQFMNQGMGQQILGGGGGGGGGGMASSNVSSSKKKKRNTEFTYDVCGWIILACGIVAWVGMAKSLGPPPPAR
ncbi:F17L21.18 [Arabidopsis thaliana]|nr:F17L21.18 [Arabidopsis thaliana]